jgi:isopenicillin-N epimerase
VASNDDGNYLRNLMAEEYATHAAFTSFDGAGYMRLSAHVYNTAAEYEEFAERVVPALCKLAKDKSPSQNGRAPAGVR